MVKITILIIFLVTGIVLLINQVPLSRYNRNQAASSNKLPVTPTDKRSSLEQLKLKAKESSLSNQLKTFNFNQILSGKNYLLLDKSTDGYTISYPPEAKVKNYPQDEIANLETVAELKPLSATEISLVAQPEDNQTELFDGLIITIISYSNPNKLSLEESLHPQPNQYSGIIIDQVAGLKLGSYSSGNNINYYFLIDHDQKLLKISYYNMAPSEQQQESYSQVAEKIISTLRFK